MNPALPEIDTEDSASSAILNVGRLIIDAAIKELLSNFIVLFFIYFSPLKIRLSINIAV
jgi:hypothetical protein